MKFNRFDYWIWENFFSKEEIYKINRFIETNLDQDESPRFAARNKKGVSKKFLTTKQIQWNKIRPLLWKLEDAVHWINQEHFEFHLHPFSSKLMCNYNIYSSKTKDHYGWHYDQATEIEGDMKFTVLINLSEKHYQGGKFEIFNGITHTVERYNKPGDVLMFKSFLNHRVKKVIKGERKTLTIFTFGPRWK